MDGKQFDPDTTPLASRATTLTHAVIADTALAFEEERRMRQSLR
jgi:hypothetical protein